jgi:diguanylate cyclase (GGDEF)-like protein
MIDLDRFKDTNDRFGHEAGDQVLCAVADCMREVLRAEDLYGRWGGDEFLVALPATDEAGAHAAVIRIREAAGNVELGDVGLSHGVPLSAGSATGVLASPRDLIREADLALYAEKATRRESQSTTGRT